MAGANWRRKDYQALAEITALILKRIPSTTHRGQIILENIVAGCMANAAMTRTGNRNFDIERFKTEVVRLYNK